MTLDAEYDNRARVPEHPAVLARWAETAAAARAAHPPIELAYGPGPRHRLDLFPAGAGAPVAVFLHGGYWQALDRGWFSGLAPALRAHGVALAIPSYDLCPDATLADILDQTAAAVDRLTAEVAAPALVFGHSAGGHMAAWLLAEGRVRRAVAISGVFELEPLAETRLNAALRLDAATARALSPRWRPPPAGATLDCWVGADESAEFLRQSRDMAAAWAAGGVATRYVALEGLNHFTVLDPLFDPASAEVARLVELARG
jgi:arylformamidase